MVTPVRKSVQFFYDILSPYSCVAFEVLCRYQSKWKMDLDLKPIYLPGIFKSTGIQGHLTVAHKAQYLIKDIQMLNEHYKIPIHFPKNFADIAIRGGSLPAMRFLTSVNLTQPKQLHDVTHELFKRYFCMGKDILQATSMAEAACSVGMSDAATEETVGNIGSEKVKAKLKDATEEALNLGVFGAPTMLVNTEAGTHMLWGSDRIPVLADLLGEKYEGPLKELARM